MHAAKFVDSGLDLLTMEWRDIVTAAEMRFTRHPTWPGFTRDAQGGIHNCAHRPGTQRGVYRQGPSSKNTMQAGQQPC
jgi:hypothetical protein